MKEGEAMENILTKLEVYGLKHTHTRHSQIYLHLLDLRANIFILYISNIDKHRTLLYVVI